MSKSKILGLLTLLFVLPAIGLAQKRSKNMVPVLDAISPTSATAGGSSLTLTVTGSNFTSGSVVQWNASSLPTTVVDDTQLQASVSGSQVASAGTAQITVYTSGRWGGTSNGLTFTINAPPPTTTTTTTSPPPPSPSPLSIDTSSVPGGTSGTAYNTPLAASGGTPAYAWSTVSGGGTLPPGLALSSSGTLSGTPSAAGAYSFTVQANDSSSTQQTAQKVFSLTVASPPPPPGGGPAPLFQTGFEPSDPAWDLVWNSTDVTITSAPPPGRSGNAVQIHYHICGDSTNTACGEAHQDSNRFVSKYFNSANGYPHGLDHFFIRGYVYLKSPEPGGSKDIQRKLFYLMSPSGPNHPGYEWAALVDTFAGSETGDLPNVCFTFVNDVPGVPAINYFASPYVYLNYDRWYSVEIEVQANTPDVSDGAARVWINGTKIIEKTGLLYRTNGYSEGITIFQVGDQADRGLYLPVDEYRYWDDVVISLTGPIGP
jgi:hypothetical protein